MSVLVCCSGQGEPDRNISASVNDSTNCRKVSKSMGESVNNRKASTATTDSAHEDSALALPTESGSFSRRHARSLSNDTTGDPETEAVLDIWPLHLVVLSDEVRCVCVCVWGGVYYHLHSGGRHPLIAVAW